MKSYENILTSCQQRVEYGDLLYSDLNDRLEDLSAEDLAANSAVYHRDCYQKLTNVICLERAKERLEIIRALSYRFQENSCWKTIH